MNIHRFLSDMKDVEVVKEFLALAGTTYELAFPQLQAVSDKQRDFGADVRIRALANIWRPAPKEYQTSDFANALIRATNHHLSAKWWIDRESHTLAPGGFTDLDDDIEKELENA